MSKKASNSSNIFFINKHKTLITQNSSIRQTRFPPGEESII